MSRYLPPEAEALVETLPDSFATTIGIEGLKGRCVEASRIAVAVLSKMGTSCRAMACDADALNAAAEAARLADTPSNEWPVDAYSVGMRCDDTVTGRNFHEPARRRGFAGHLVVVGDDWFVDLTAAQLSRPDRGIVIPGAMAGPYVPGDTGVQCLLGDGAALRYFWRPEIAHWRTTPAWRQDIPPLLMDAAIRAIRHRLDPTQPPPYQLEDILSLRTPMRTTKKGSAP